MYNGRLLCRGSCLARLAAMRGSTAQGSATEPIGRAAKIQQHQAHLSHGYHRSRVSTLVLPLLAAPHEQSCTFLQHQGLKGLSVRLRSSQLAWLHVQPIRAQLGTMLGQASGCQRYVLSSQQRLVED